MDFNTIQALTADDMAKVDTKILAQLNSDVALINQLGFYIVSGGGKRLRPILAVLSAKALNYQAKVISRPLRLSNSFTQQHCCMMTSSMNLTCVGAKPLPMPCLVMQQVSWSAITSTPAPSK